MNSHETIAFRRWKTIRSDLAAKRASGAKWREIALEYPGVPIGTLYRVYAGQMPHKPAIRRALGLTRRRNTFAENAADYDAWCQAHAAELAAIVAWAERHT